MFHRKQIRPLLPVAAVVGILSLLILGTAACGNGSAGGSGSITHPKGKSEVVLRVSTGGGFVAPSYNLTAVPDFTLYGDGTVVVPGPMIEIYPGPALPNLQATTVTEETVQAILSAVQEAGLLNTDFDYGLPGITDMPTTTITVNIEGTTYQTGIYALYADAAGGGLTMEQQQARAAVAALIGQLVTMEGFQSGLTWDQYHYTALAVYSTPAPTGGTPDVQPNTLVWPLSDLGTLGEPVPPQGYRKVVVTGSDLEKLRPLLSEATQITVWTSGNMEYNLAFRPLLPDETTQ